MVGETLAKAGALHIKGELGKALLLYKRVIEKDALNVQAIGGIAAIYYQKDDIEKANHYFRRALSLAPNDPGLLLNWGNCLHLQGDLCAATEAFQRAASLRAFPEAHVNLGNVLHNRGLTREAIAEYRKALSLRPAYPRALRRLGLLLAIEGAATDDVPLLLEASAHLVTVLAATANDTDVRGALARCEWRLARYSRDPTRFRAALEELEKTGEAELEVARTELSRLFLDLGDDANSVASLPAKPEVPSEWNATVLCGAPFNWSTTRPLGIVEEEACVLLAGERDWFTLKGHVLRYEDMTNANADAGQYVRVIAPSGRLIASLPPISPPASVGEAILIGGLGNYYHWLLDYLPRLRLILQRPDLDEFPLVVNQSLAGYQTETLKHLGIAPARLHSLPSGTAVPFRRLLVPELGTLGQHPHPETLAWLRATFPKRPAERRRRLWVSRQDASFRRVENEADIMALLAERGFEKVVPGQMSVTEQASMFAEADVIVAPHGAALANVVFCAPGAKVVELMPGRHNQLGFFPPLSEDCGLRHWRVDCEPRPTPQQQKETSGQNFDMYVPPETIRNILDQCLA